MIKQIVFLLSMFGCAFSLTANAEKDSVRRETTSVTESSGVVKKRVLAIQDDYDIETYDIYGNLQQYHYEDFEYRDNVDLNGYVPTKSASTWSTYDKYKALPYSAVCTVYTTFDTDGDGAGDKTFIGSGSLVGADEVLTAEENTYNTDYGYPTDLYVVPGEHRENGTLTRPFGVQHWTAIMRGRYHTTFDANDNWALIRLNSKIGYTTGWLGVSDSGVSNGTTVKALGYDSYASCNSTVYSGVVSSSQTYKFNYSAIPSAISNGCPVMDASLSTILGIHCSKRVSVNGTNYAQACKVSIYIKGWIQEDCGPIRISIFAIADSSSSSSGLNTSGHAWITVKNNSTYAIMIGKMSISPNTGVSLGTWGNTSHVGLYYNLEYNRAQAFAGRVSYSRNIFSSQWDNDYVLENDEWSLLDNCSNFAVGLWNSMLSSQYEISFNGSLPTPANVKNRLLQFSGYETNATIIGNANVGYYNGDLFVYSQN